MVEPVRGSGDLVSRVVEFGMVGGDALLAALLARLGKDDQLEQRESPPAAEGVGTDTDDELSNTVTGALLAGEGRYTAPEVVDWAGIDLDVARRLWRALGFPEVDDDQRIFTNADVAALTDAGRLIATGIVDPDTLVQLARPLGNLMSRLAAAQTAFISEVLGERIATGLTADDPQLSDRLAAQALITTRELLPVLERTTLHAWRRHLSAEMGRSLIPGAIVDDTESRPATVGFIDIAGFTRLSRNVDLTELAELLNRFETAVLDAVVEHGGRVIKNLGDEILFVIDDPVSAADATLRLVDDFSTDDTLPPLHAGLAFGPVLYRGGDVYGPVVNVASRLAGLARKGTVRVDEGLAAELGDAGQFVLSARTPRHVRGYLQLPNYRLRRSKKH